MEYKFMIQRQLLRELRLFQDEGERLRTDLIRFKNKYLRKSNPLDVWVVIK